MSAIASSAPLAVPSRTATERRAGFTLTELLVIVAVVAVLVSLQLPALARVTRQTKVAQCAENLRQFTQALQIYGHENNDRLPANPNGFWAWDLQWSIPDALARYGASWRVMYCPGTAPRFTDVENLELFNYVPNNFHVIGYSHTFTGSTIINATNLNATLTPPPINISVGVVMTPLASERVLLADATISSAGQDNENLRDTYNYTVITGGYAQSHTSPHLSGRIPLGGNVSMLDGRVQWRRFLDMHPRTQGAAPVFWW